MNAKLFIVVGALIAFSSCWKGNVYDPTTYASAVNSGFQRIPQSRQFHDLFGDANHFITFSGPTNGTKVWNSKAYFGGRYVLTMQVDVVLNKAGDAIQKTTGPIRFYLDKYATIGMNASGSWQATYDPSGELEFGDLKWQELVEAEGDWASIGAPLDLDRPLANFDAFVAAWQEDIVQIKPK